MIGEKRIPEAGQVQNQVEFEPLAGYPADLRSRDVARRERTFKEHSHLHSHSS